MRRSRKERRKGSSGPAHLVDGDGVAEFRWAPQPLLLVTLLLPGLGRRQAGAVGQPRVLEAEPKVTVRVPVDNHRREVHGAWGGRE